MEVKSYNHQSIAQWSNSKLHSQLIACAQINPDQNNLYNLEILSLDLSEKSKNLNVMGNAFYNVPFRCLAWDTFGEKENTFTHGVIFGGMEDGSYTLWNAGQMILNYARNQIVKTQDNIQNQPAFLYGEQPEQGSYPIMCAEWNSLKNSFLAFGSTQLLILDIGKDISNPQIQKPGNRNPHQGSYITSVSWNKEVANILASASENGLIALWDIKSNKSIFQFKDSPSSNNGNRNVVICWSKTFSTQLAVTLDDQKRNQVQIWDLRRQKGPVAVYDRGHTKGINAMQWCQTDPDLILTAGRDNKIVCWNCTQGQTPVSTQQLNQSIFDLKWSKKLKSIYSLALQDRTQIYTMDNTNLFSYVPKWYRVPIESCFLGNESLIRYSQSQGQQLTEIRLSPSIQNQSSPIHKLFKELEDALDEASDGQRNKQSQFWNLIAIKNSNQGDDGIYDFLGFNKQKIIKQVQKYTGKKQGNHTQKTTQAQSKTKSKAYTPIIGQQAASFFASIGQNQMKSSRHIDSDNEQNQNVKYEMVSKNLNWNIGKERLIKHNILIGNYQGAIDAALKCGRTAEALVIAYSLDASTFNQTLKTFFTETTDNFITDILKNITYRDNQQLVRKYDIQAWKECVAMIYSLSTSQKRKHLLNLLALRIREQNLKKNDKLKQIEILSEDNPAIQCYVLSQNFNQIANLYYDNLKNFENGTNQRKLAVIQYAKRLILVYNSLSIEIQPCKNFHKIIRQTAFIATEENYKMIAYLLFSNYIYETSMKQVDMIIHATKNLQEYRNSVVFKQINIPVMQLKDQNQNKQQHAQKGAKKAPNPQQFHEQQVQKLPPQYSQPTNPNVPTKDKNLIKPPIFGKREQQKEITQKPAIVPPPPFNQNKPRVQAPVYDPEYQEPEAPKNKNTQKKVPPPPGFKGPQKVNETVTHGTQQEYSQDQLNQERFENTEKKLVPPLGRGKKIPPPPPTNFSNQQREQPILTQPIQIKKPVPRPQHQNIKSFHPPFHHESKMPLQPTVHQQSRVPPPAKSSGKQLQTQVYHQQRDEEDQQQETQPVQSQKQIQQVYQQSHENRSLKQPLFSNSNKVPPPPLLKPSNQKDDHNTSFSHSLNQQSSNHNKPPQIYSAKKMVLPPPPPGAKRQVQQSEEQKEAVTISSKSKLESSSMVKPPPPASKLGGKMPPPPSRIQAPNQHVSKPQNAQQHPHYISQHHQEEESQEPERSLQYQTPVIKRPPPPVSNKRGPPPPPRR